MTKALEALVFSKRIWILAIFVLLTVFLGYRCSLLRIDAGFEKLLPLGHPYMKTYVEHREAFGGANRILIAVRAKDGDIFTPEFFETLKEVTDAVFFLPGINRSTVQSLFTPNVRFIEIVEGGFTGGNVVPADFQGTDADLETVRENVLKAGIVGRLVANDFSAAMITAQLVETDPTTGEKLDYIMVSKLLEKDIREKFQSDEIDIHILGFAKVMGDIAAGASGVALFFLVALLVTAILVYLFTVSWRLTLLPLFCSIIAVVWCLGLLQLLGYGIDPMSLLVPFLVFAIGVSHGVQMVNAFGEGVWNGVHGEDAARAAFRSLLVPGWIALLSDTVGFLTLLLIKIRIIQELAITASLGVLVIVGTNLILLPILLSYIRLGEKYNRRIHRSAGQKEPVWRFLTKFTAPSVARPTVMVAIALGLIGLWYGRGIAIGDTQAGVPELRPDSRYNRDTAMVTEKFSIGLDILSVIVETVPDGCIEYDVMDGIDDFEWQMSQVPGVQSTLSLAKVAKVVNAGWNEGHPAWRIIPRNPATLSQAVSPVETSSGLLNSDCSTMPVMLFLEDHRAETIDRVVAAAEDWAVDHDSDRHTFRLATGNVGVMAATNQVVEQAQFQMLLYVYAAVVLLCLLTFRSVRASFCIILPLALTSMLGYGLMTWLGIGLKTTTLPVAALGVGIGVDYGIYIFSRMKEELEAGLSISKAYRDTLRVAGNAVLVTGLTLAIGVSTWIASDLQFQADMGVLLTFMFLANMLGAILLLPALATLLYRPKRRAAA
ncbi:MAG: RND family transporter [Candidatus Eisenbacteria bacterium]|uniref:RND family transporter n=1 Tax=Eiseniibacteriota bacterium TaxID=2212470 RepID=A0A956NEK1_UNCEI|nr:RND family transporter [Candidatus Eisenbacteria bacterium]